MMSGKQSTIKNLNTTGWGIIIAEFFFVWTIMNRIKITNDPDSLRLRGQLAAHYQNNSHTKRHRVLKYLGLILSD